jgi:hypothetical protein
VLLGLPVRELAVVHHPANRWIGIGRHLHQVELELRGSLSRGVCRDDAELLAVGVDQADLRNPDLFVDPVLFLFGNTLAPCARPAEQAIRRMSLHTGAAEP